MASLINNDAWDFTPISYSPDEMSLMEDIKADADKVAAMFGMPVEMLTGTTSLAMLEANQQKFDEMLRHYGIPGRSGGDR